jgi:hypothetical protein
MDKERGKEKQNFQKASLGKFWVGAKFAQY